MILIVGSIKNRHPHFANTRFPAAFVRFDGDDVFVFHLFILLFGRLK